MCVSGLDDTMRVDITEFNNVYTSRTSPQTTVHINLSIKD